VTQTAASTATPTSAASVAVFAIEVRAADLDVSNNFNHVQFTIPDTGSNAQLGCAFYIAYGVKYPQSIQSTFLN
jgi:hypothetical protein